MHAPVDLDPHQVDAALFAFRSPLPKGALLADDVGLGKAIEAGSVLSQRWVERRRHLLVITPSNPRRQGYQELTEKSFLPCRVLEAKLAGQRRVRALEAQWNEPHRSPVKVQDRVGARRGRLSAESEAKLVQGTQLRPVFELGWQLTESTGSAAWSRRRTYEGRSSRPMAPRYVTPWPPRTSKPRTTRSASSWGTA